jgi:hypothetical protein
MPLTELERICAQAIADLIACADRARAARLLAGPSTALSSPTGALASPPSGARGSDLDMDLVCAAYETVCAHLELIRNEAVH